MKYWKRIQYLEMPGRRKQWKWLSTFERFAYKIIGGRSQGNVVQSVSYKSIQWPQSLRTGTTVIGKPDRWLVSSAILKHKFYEQFTLHRCSCPRNRVAVWILFLSCRKSYSHSFGCSNCCYSNESYPGHESIVGLFTRNNNLRTSFLFLLLN